MRITDLAAAMESIAPLRLSEEWDNTGLIIGSASSPLNGPVLLTIDLTEQVADEAARKKCSAVIAYHPPIFAPIKRLADVPGAPSSERIALRMARAGIAVYSPHTALDAAEGGVTDWLADALAGKTCADRRAIRPAALEDPRANLKLVTFVPESALDQVRDALATAGAGLIGNYERCSFGAPGTGTFLGNESANPRVGKKGVLERVPEVRLEMVCSRRALAVAITTLRQFHPYEEPPIDVFPLEPGPDRRIGVGRRMLLDHPVPLTEIADRLKKRVGSGPVQIATPPGDQHRNAACIGVVPGSGGGIARDALADGCDAFITGEMKHHDVLAALAGGMSVILGGHTATERGYLPVLAKRLAKALPEASFLVSADDMDPLITR